MQHITPLDKGSFSCKCAFTAVITWYNCTKDAIYVHYQFYVNAFTYDETARSQLLVYRLIMERAARITDVDIFEVCPVNAHRD